jgi:hypothetical protein
VRYVAVLVVLVVAVGWCLAEVHIAGDSAQGVTDGLANSELHGSGPEWRRTSEGWVKVGADGAAGLVTPQTEPAKPPRLHPGLLSAFLLAAALVSLIWFDRAESEASP